MIDKDLSDFVQTGVPSLEEQKSFISHVCTLSHNSKKEQFVLLSLISNYHWFDWPSMTSSRISKHQFVTYAEHILVDVEEKEEGNLNRKYIPPSPRNRIMYILSVEDTSADLTSAIKHLMSLDHPDPQEQASTDQAIDIPEPPPRKRRKNAAHLVSVSSRAILNMVGESEPSSLNAGNPNRSLYTCFKEQLIGEGKIMWREHTAEKDVCVMSDINSTNGLLLPNSFVHVTSFIADDGQQVLKCTCSIFGLIQRAGHQEIQLWPEEDCIPDDQLTCIHCCYFKEFLVGAFDKVQSGQSSLTRPLQMVKDSLQYINTNIQLLGSVLPKGTTKFSVKGEGSIALVHFSFPQGKCYAKCMDGMCAAKLRNKKKIPKSVALQKNSNLCGHMNMIAEQIDYVKSFFPGYFGVENPETPIQLIQEEEVNTDDGDIGSSLKGNFNLETGLWEYKAHSKHIPHQQMDPKLVQATQECNDLPRPQHLDQETGLYKPFLLKPSPLDPDGNQKLCSCGSKYPTDANYNLEGTATL